MRAKVKIAAWGFVIWAFVALSSCLWLAPHRVLAQRHWEEVSYPSTFSPPVPYEGPSTGPVPGSSGNKVQWKHSASANECRSSFTLQAVDSYGYSLTGSTASLWTGKRMEHSSPAHSPMNAVASGSGSITFSASVSGTVAKSGASSGSAAASGSISALGSNIGGEKSLSVNGSCSAETTGSVGISKDGVSVSNTSPPPGTYSGAETHSAVLNVGNYAFQGSAVTMSVAASATISSSIYSGSYWVFWYGTAMATGQASAKVGPLMLDVNCLPGEY